MHIERSAIKRLYSARFRGRDLFGVSLVSFFSVLLLACGGNGGGPVVSEGELTELALWEPLSEDRDPFRDHRPDALRCVSGFGEEEGIFEVNTESCPYATFEQPAKLSLPAGSCVGLAWWHLLLSSEDEGASAHVAMLIGEQVLFERNIPIPHPSRSYSETYKLDRAVTAGSPVQLHLHNHGANSWRFPTLEAQPCR